MFDDYIITKPTFLRGAARALDLGGALCQDAFVLSNSPADADARAMESDWRVTNRDLNQARETMERELSPADAA